MPANDDEIRYYTWDVTGSGAAFDWAMALRADLGESLLYGPQYRRAAWDNYCDAILFARRGEWEDAERYALRARAAAS